VLREWRRKYPREFKKLMKEYLESKCSECGSRVYVCYETGNPIPVEESRWAYTTYERIVFKRLSLTVGCPDPEHGAYVIFVDVMRRPRNPTKFRMTWREWKEKARSAREKP